jgi:hypothetical protein
MRRLASVFFVSAAFGLPAQAIEISAPPQTVGVAVATDPAVGRIPLACASLAADRTLGLLPVRAADRKGEKAVKPTRTALVRTAPAPNARPPGPHITLVLGVGF